MILTSHFSLLTPHFSLLTSHFSLLTSHSSLKEKASASEYFAEIVATVAQIRWLGWHR